VSLFFQPREQRSLSYQDVFGSGGSLDLLGTGIEGAARLVPVYAAWRLIADQFASTPWHAYRESPDGTRQRMSSQPKLMTNPSPVGLSQSAWKTQCIVSMLARGNAVGYDVGSTAFPSGLVWLNPDRVSCDESGAVPEYYYEGRHLDRARVTHIPWFLLPGKFWGLSPIGAFRTLLETGHSAQATARDWFANGAIPSVHLQNTAKVLSADDATAAKTRYKAAVVGRDALVTGNDWDLKTIGVPADEARFIETLKLTATQVATIYGIPPEMIGGETGSSMIYATVEQNLLNFATLTMRPWFTRVEETISDLLPKPQYVKFNLDVIVRADLKSRMEAHDIAQRIGIETNDEARAVEDRAPLTPEQKSEWLDVWKRPADPKPGTR
jgi:HK97 family phage portal protein